MINTQKSRLFLASPRTRLWPIIRKAQTLSKVGLGHNTFAQPLWAVVGSVVGKTAAFSAGYISATTVQRFFPRLTYVCTHVRARACVTPFYRCTVVGSYYLIEKIKKKATTLPTTRPQRLGQSVVGDCQPTENNKILPKYCHEVTHGA